MFFNSCADVFLLFHLQTPLKPTLMEGTDNVCISGTRHQQICNTGIQFTKAAITKHDPIVGAVQNDAGFQKIECRNSLR